MKQYRVELTSEECSLLQQIVAKGNTAGYRMKYVHILLKADQGKNGPSWSDPKIAEAFGCNLSTAYRLRKRLIEDGLDAVLQHGNAGKHKQFRLDGKAGARLIALACGQPPEGRQRWTVPVIGRRTGFSGDCGFVVKPRSMRRLKK